MRFTIVTLLAIFFFPILSKAQENIPLPGKMYQTWVIPVQKEPVRKGLLYGVTDSSLIISNSLHKEDYQSGHYGIAEMNYLNINMVKIRKEGKLEKGVLIGGIAGITTGLALGLYFYGNSSESEIFGDIFNVIGTALITIAGTAVGIGVGFASTGFKITIPLHGKVEDFNLQKARMAKYSYMEIAGGGIPGSRMFKKSAEKVTDIDNNIYETAIAGGRTWMAENLKATRFSNGDPIPEVSEKDEWSRLSGGAYCNPMNNPDHAGTHGRLYNRFTVNDARNICPQGWHVPSYSEWKALIDTIGGPDHAGIIMTDTRLPEWSKVNRGSAPYNTFAELAGNRDKQGNFTPPGISGRYTWTGGGEQEVIIGLLLESKRDDVRFVSKQEGENSGMSVRCVKD